MFVFFSDLFLCAALDPQDILILPGATGRLEGTQSLPNLKAGWFERDRMDIEIWLRFPMVSSFPWSGSWRFDRHFPSFSIQFPTFELLPFRHHIFQVPPRRMHNGPTMFGRTRVKHPFRSWSFQLRILCNFENPRLWMYLIDFAYTYDLWWYKIWWYKMAWPSMVEGDSLCWGQFRLSLLGQNHRHRPEERVFWFCRKLGRSFTLSAAISADGSVIFCLLKPN